VSDATAEKIRSAAQQRGYRPNRSAQQLAGGRSHALGLVVAQQAPIVTFRRMEAIEMAAAQHGLRVIIGRFDESNPALIQGYLDDFSSRNVDGIIFIDHHGWSRQTVAEIVAKLGSTPLVFQSQGQLPAGVARVRLDLNQGSVEAVNYLVGRGHRRIGLAINGGTLPSFFARETGFRTACGAHGPIVESRGIWLPSTPRQTLTAEDLGQMIQQLVDEQKATALMVENDYWALQLIGEFERRGRRVPSAVAVVGYNNLEFSGLIHPSLTTLDENHEAVASHLVRLVVAGIALRGKRKRPPAEDVIIRPTLVARESA
jgi:DNA-binding LacI/PurR family transcriptional regulator